MPAPKKFSSEKLVTVYPPDGGPGEKHSIPNARDLVNGAGYTWDKKQRTNPASTPPFAVSPNDPRFQREDLAQKVLDTAGAASNRGRTLAPDALQGNDEDPEAEPLEDGEDDEEVLDEEETSTAAPEKKKRTRRSKKNQTPAESAE